MIALATSQYVKFNELSIKKGVSISELIRLVIGSYEHNPEGFNLRKLEEYED